MILPAETLVHLFEFLDAREDHECLRLVSKQFRSTVASHFPPKAVVLGPRIEVRFKNGICTLYMWMTKSMRLPHYFEQYKKTKFKFIIPSYLSVQFQVI